MGDFSIGIALFVLIIVVGLIIGLRLSSTSPQRRAVAAAFASMALVAVLFWLVAMNASQVWTAPFFAIACIVVPLASYMGVMKAAKAAQAARRREEPTMRVRTEPRTRTVKPGSGVDGALMPVAPNHPVNEFRSLNRPPVEEDELLEEESFDEAMLADGEIVAEAVADAAPHAEGADEAEVAEVEAAADGAAEGVPADEPTGPEPEAEAFIEEYLVEQNEGDDGMFEPEVSPTLQAPPGSSHSTSTMMLTVPFAEGDERYLVVSDTETVPNPILAFKRTTSSHLVPLGSAQRGSRPKHASDAVAGTPSVAPAIPEAVASPEAQPEVPFKLRPRALDPDATGEVDFAAIFGTAEKPAPSDDSQLELDFTAVPEPTPVRPATPEPVRPEPVTVPAPTPAAAPEPVRPESVTFPAPVPAAAPAPAPAAPVVVAEPTPVRPEPVSVPASEPVVEPMAAPEPAPVPKSQPAPRPEPAVVVPAPEPVAAPQPAPVPKPQPAPAPAPRPQVVLAPQPAPAPAPQPEPDHGIQVPADFVPAAVAPASTREARFEEFLAKAQSLRDKGLYPVAARLYGEAAAAAEGADARRALFEEMACYVKAGQGDKARALAAELRHASVLTRVERIKLDAVERMG